MKQLKIFWKKELKNSVPFFVYINGVECGIIKRGEALLFNVPTDCAEVYFVPKAPKWFGWKALKIKIEFTAPLCEMTMAVQVTNEAKLFGKLVEAANCENQFHCIICDGANVIEAEYVKKYK